MSRGSRKVYDWLELSDEDRERLCRVHKAESKTGWSILKHLIFNCPEKATLVQYAKTGKPEPVLAVQTAQIVQTPPKSKWERLLNPAPMQLKHWARSYGTSRSSKNQISRLLTFYGEQKCRDNSFELLQSLKKKID